MSQEAHISLSYNIIKYIALFPLQLGRENALEKT